MWRQFIDRFAQKEPWELLTRLRIKDCYKLSPARRQALRPIILADVKYEDSCFEAVKKQDLHNEINLRAIMTLRLLIVGHFSRAEINAQHICSKIINSPSSDIKLRDLRKVRRLLARVQEAQLAFDGGPTTSFYPTNTPLNLKRYIQYAITHDLLAIAKELLPPLAYDGGSTTSSAISTSNIIQELNEGCSDTEGIEIKCTQIKCAIAQYLQERARELLLRSIRNRVKLQVSEARIFWSKQQAERYKQFGAVLGTIGIIVLIGLCVLVGVSFYVLLKVVRTARNSSKPLARVSRKARNAKLQRMWGSLFATCIFSALALWLWKKEESISKWISLNLVVLSVYPLCTVIRYSKDSKDSNPIPQIAWGSVFPAIYTLVPLILMYSRDLWEKGKSMRKEFETLTRLNTILAKAQKYHDEGNMQGALNALSEDEQFLSLQELGETRSRDKLIDLIKYGIGADGVAAVFKLMGEAFKSPQVEIPNWDSDDLLLRAEKSFQWILDDELEQAAQDLDKSITEIKEQRSKKSRWEQYVERWKNFLLLRDEDDAILLASAHPDKDAQRALVEKRLEAMRHFVQMDQISTEMDIKTDLAEKDGLVERLVREARGTIECDFNEPCSETIKDLLAVISDHTKAIPLQNS